MKNESQKLKVSIIIPTYNQEAFIRDAINSALQQTYPNLEVIVGDDASTDTTLEILAETCDPRVKYVRNPYNLGRNANYRNLLYCHTTGDFVVNLDGDDYYTDPDFITEAVKIIECTENVVIVLARATAKTYNQEFVSEIPDNKNVTGMQILKRLPSCKFHFMHMTALYDRKIALKIDFYRSSAISSDWESLYRLSLRGRVKFMDRNVGIWRIHGTNETETTNPAKLLDNLTIWPSIYKDAVSLGMNSLLAKFISAKCIAFSAQLSCVRVSRYGNSALVKFVMDVVRTYNFSALLLFLTPKYLARVLLCFAGYYRQKTHI